MAEKTELQKQMLREIWGPFAYVAVAPQIALINASRWFQHQIINYRYVFQLMCRENQYMPIPLLFQYTFLRVKELIM